MMPQCDIHAVPSHNLIASSADRTVDGEQGTLWTMAVLDLDVIGLCWMKV